ncbi:putative membrane protein [Yersinia enterocolitica]|nr:putative membrane protein [Yersinia enterocolitica]
MVLISYAMRTVLSFIIMAVFVSRRLSVSV